MSMICYVGYVFANLRSNKPRKENSKDPFELFLHDQVRPSDPCGTSFSFLIWLHHHHFIWHHRHSRPHIPVRRSRSRETRPSPIDKLPLGQPTRGLVEEDICVLIEPGQQFVHKIGGLRCRSAREPKLRECISHQCHR